MNMKPVDYNVVDYGAVGDGATLDTVAIQQAVDACAAAGGGRVVLPGGIFLSGPVFLKSHIEFHLSAGAVLRGSPNFQDYPDIDFDMRGYHIWHWVASLLTGIGLRDIAITGHGVIEGNGAVWWQAMDEDRLSNQRCGLKRPVLVSLNNCERVIIRDIQATTSPSWTFRLWFCDNLTVDNVSVKNTWNHYHNTDGINLVSCRDARIVNCHVDTGDDGITLKSVPDFHMTSTTGQPDYTKPHIPCENILIGNCVVRHAHGGVVIGSETVGGVRNVAVNNCVFDGTRSGIKIKGSQFGGQVQNLSVSNVIMRRVELAIDLHARDPFEESVPKDGPHIATMQGIHFSNITIEQSCIGLYLKGLPGYPARDISFVNLRIEADQGVILQDAVGVRFDKLTVNSRSVPLSARDVVNLELRGVCAVPPSTELPALQFENVREAWIHGCTAAPGTNVFLGLVGTGNDVRMEANRMEHATRVEAAIEPANSWNTCSHAFSGSRMLRDTGEQNVWLPVSAAVMDTVRCRWTPAQIDRIFSVSRVEANSRYGAEVEDASERRRIYIVEAHAVDERLVILEDGELLRTVSDPDFHAAW